MQTFTIRDLRDRSGELIRIATEGKLSVVSEDGTPVFIALPFDETLLKYGVNIALAIKLFDEEAVSLGTAARLAEMSLSSFIDLLGRMHIPIARYESGEIEKELDRKASASTPGRCRFRR